MTAATISLPPLDLSRIVILCCSRKTRAANSPAIPAPMILMSNIELEVILASMGGRFEAGDFKSWKS